uniref:Coilin n=1 Tax=Cebus imitator TaxID=2715852 RepID=A0A2K5QRG5_CEBIM
MAASETVRLRLQFDYPPPATPHCTAFWLLVDLNRCRVVTDLISLIRQRFGFSSGALLGLYLEGGLLPPAESARLVRDNDCLRVKLEERGVAENSVVISNGDSTNLSLRKAKKRSFKLEEDEETEPDYKYSKKRWKRQENSNNEKALDLEPKAVTDKTVSQKKRRKNKATGGTAGDNEETKRKPLKKKEKREYKKKAKNPKSLKVQAVKDWATERCSSPKGSARNSLAKAKRKGGVNIGSKESPSFSSESGSCHESISDGPSKVTLEARNSSEKLPTELSKEEPATRNTTADKLATKPGFSLTPSKGKTSGTSSSSSDSSSDSDDQCSLSTPECAAGFLKTVGLFAERGCLGPGLSLQTAGAAGWKRSGSDGGGQAPGPSPSISLPTSLGRGWGRGENLFSWKGARGRGMRGRGRGRGHPVSCVMNRSTDNQRQQQLNEVVTNSSTIIQNPVDTHKDYSLLPLLAAAPRVGEKIAFKEGKILSHNPETQQVDIEILSSLPALREPGKFDLVYHNENGTEVVEYAVTQESKITVFWRELIDPRLIIESPSNTSNTEPV